MVLVVHTVNYVYNVYNKQWETEASWNNQDDIKKKEKYRIEFLTSQYMYLRFFKTKILPKNWDLKSKKWDLKSRNGIKSLENGI